MGQLDMAQMISTFHLRGAIDPANAQRAEGDGRFREERP